MIQISNADFCQILRLLFALSKTQGKTLKEKENARKSAVLFKKLSKRYAKGDNIQVNNQSAGLPGREVLASDGVDRPFADGRRDGTTELYVQQPIFTLEVAEKERQEVP